MEQAGTGKGMGGNIEQRRFAQLLEEHRRIVFKVAAVYAWTEEDRRDLAQEIAVQLWRSFASYDERRAKFSTWMYRIALNVAISQVRRGTVRTESLEDHQLESFVGGAGVVEPDERLVALHRFIDGLDSLNRALILLYLEERSYAEMAAVLGISETNVATKIGRIKRKLREQAVAESLTSGA
jgi:RNA polymerase sigma factor (sigma-70 family)